LCNSNGQNAAQALDICLVQQHLFLLLATDDWCGSSSDEEAVLSRRRNASSQGFDDV
jgi:hypothetical protein